MAIVRMKKLWAVVLKENAAPLILQLQKTGMVEFIKTRQMPGLRGDGPGHPGTLTGVEAMLGEIRSVRAVVNKYDHSKKSFLTARPAITLSQLNEDRREPVEEAIRQIKSIEEKINSIRQKQTRIQNITAQLEPFKNLDIKTEALGYTKSTYSVCGFIPKEHFSQINGLEDELNGLVYVKPLLAEDELNGLLYVKPLPANAEFIPVFLLVHLSVLPKAKERLKELTFTEVHLEETSLTFAGQIRKLESELTQLNEQMDRAEKSAEAAARFGPMLDAAEDSLKNELVRQKAYEYFASTGAVNILEGWVRFYDEQAVLAEIERISEACYGDFTDPAPEDDVPTALDNGPLVEPVEAVTQMYDTPGARGIDPNALILPFFFVFFGMMLSDAGYGILLSIGAYLMYRFKKPDKDTMSGKVMRLLVITGVSTLIWGVLFGGWMGFELPPLWFNPLKEPMTMLIVCLSVGLIHIIASLVTGAYVLIRRGQIADAIFDKVFWILILIAAPMFLLSSATAAILLTTGAVGLLLTQGRHNKSIVKKILGGFASLYNVTGYLSDVLSYARIFGMALATGVIAMVFNTIAGMLATNVVGVVFAAAVFLVGHLFNLGINTLGAYVHSCRLQYIESFSKFFEGGGRPFQPLRYKTKNYRLTE